MFKDFHKKDQLLSKTRECVTPTYFPHKHNALVQLTVDLIKV